MKPATEQARKSQEVNDSAVSQAHHERKHERKASSGGSISQRPEAAADKCWGIQRRKTSERQFLGEISKWCQKSCSELGTAAKVA